VEVLFVKPSTWQRMMLSATGIILIQISWRWAIAHLYTLPYEAYASFTTITTNSFYCIGAIVIFMVTGRLVYEWKMGTSQFQNVSSRAESIKEEIIERVHKPKYYDDEQV